MLLVKKHRLYEGFLDKIQQKKDDVQVTNTRTIQNENFEHTIVYAYYVEELYNFKLLASNIKKVIKRLYSFLDRIDMIDDYKVTLRCLDRGDNIDDKYRFKGNIQYLLNNNAEIKPKTISTEDNNIDSFFDDIIHTAERMKLKKQTQFSFDFVVEYNINNTKNHKNYFIFTNQINKVNISISTYINTLISKHVRVSMYVDNKPMKEFDSVYSIGESDLHTIYSSLIPEIDYIQSIREYTKYKNEVDDKKKAEQSEANEGNIPDFLLRFFKAQKYSEYIEQAQPIIVIDDDKELAHITFNHDITFNDFLMVAFYTRRYMKNQYHNYYDHDISANRNLVVTINGTLTLGDDSRYKDHGNMLNCIDYIKKLKVYGVNFDILNNEIFIQDVMVDEFVYENPRMSRKQVKDEMQFDASYDSYKCKDMKMSSKGYDLKFIKKGKFWKLDIKKKA